MLGGKVTGCANSREGRYAYIGALGIRLSGHTGYVSAAEGDWSAPYRRIPEPYPLALQKTLNRKHLNSKHPSFKFQLISISALPALEALLRKKRSHDVGRAVYFYPCDVHNPLETLGDNAGLRVKGSRFGTMCVQGTQFSTPDKDGPGYEFYVIGVGFK